jgi:hypothetical protein
MRSRFLARAAGMTVLASCLQFSFAQAAPLPPTTTLVTPRPVATAARLDSRLISPQSITRPITDAERQYFLSHGLIRPNDATWQPLRPVHVFRASPLGRPPFVRNAAPMAGPSNSGADLNYYSGQVLVNPVVIPVFWGFGAVNGVPNPSRDPSGVAGFAMSFLDNLASSPWLATVNQYYQGSQQFIQSQSLKVTNPIFDDSSMPAATYNNGDVHNEVARLIAAKMIGPNSSDVIVVFTPHNTTNSDLTGDCAAHYSDQGMNFFSVVHNYTYITMPYEPHQGSSCGAFKVSGALDGVSIALGHELAEAITDPYSNYLFNVGAWAGWITDPVTQGGQEIGDLCAWFDVQSTALTATASFPTQPLWSNQAQACVQPVFVPPVVNAPPPVPLTAKVLQNGTEMLGNVLHDWVIVGAYDPQGHSVNATVQILNGGGGMAAPASSTGVKYAYTCLARDVIERNGYENVNPCHAKVSAAGYTSTSIPVGSTGP